MTKSVSRLFTLAAIAVGVALLWRWWQHHRSRGAQSSDDSLLTKVIDAVAPSQAPSATAVGIQNYIPLTTPPALVGQTQTNTQPSPALGGGFVPQNWFPTTKFGTTGETPPIIVIEHAQPVGDA